LDEDEGEELKRKKKRALRGIDGDFGTTTTDQCMEEEARGRKRIRCGQRILKSPVENHTRQCFETDSPPRGGLEGRLAASTTTGLTS